MAHISMTLRAVNHRLTNLPVQKLPSIAASLAASITECGELLSAPQSQRAGKSDSDHAVQVHKLVTRLSSLLQDRSFEGRWAAVVFVKALVEAGQWEILRGNFVSIQLLIVSLEQKSDPASTKTMAVITLTRIFHLTYQYPTLVREITTPSLPGFITTTLNLISVKPPSEPTRKLKPTTPLLEVVLRAYAELIARHPTIFRPFTAQIHSLLQAIVGSTASLYSQPVLNVTEQLFVALHHCAPKNTGGEEWKGACRMTINSTHATANHVFRAIVEQWESIDPSLRQQLSHPIDYALEVGSHGPDALGLAGWQGLDAGVKRLLELLRMLSTFLTTATASTVSIPIGSVLDLTARLMSVVVPTEASDVQANPQVSRTERETLFTELPQIHIACIKVLRALIGTLETAALSVAQTILEQTLWVFRAEKSSKKVRTSVYGLLDALLKHMGPSMNKKSVSSLTEMIRICCSDILPTMGENGSKDTSSDTKGRSKTNSATVNADFFLNPNLKQSRQTNASTKSSRLSRAASNLLQSVLTHLALEYLAAPIRAEIDRTIIMTSDKSAMYASVLNPHPAVKGRGVNVSIMPFLARSYTSEMDVEALIRPRMPILTNSNSIGHYANIDEDEDEDMEHAGAPESMPAENSGFLKPAVTPSLQDLVDSSTPQGFPSSVNKRTYAEESSHSTPTSAGSLAKADSLQPKKARFDSNASTTPATTLEQPSIFSRATAAAPASIQTSSVTEETSTVGNGVTTSTTSVMVEQSSSVPQVEAATAPGDEDSDEEMPTLNIEPDTDDEDEDSGSQSISQTKEAEKSKTQNPAALYNAHTSPPKRPIIMVHKPGCPPTKPTLTQQAPQETERQRFGQPQPTPRKIIRDPGPREMKPAKHENHITKSAQPARRCKTVPNELRHYDTGPDLLDKNTHGLQDEEEKRTRDWPGILAELRVASEAVEKAADAESDNSCDNASYGALRGYGCGKKRDYPFCSRHKAEAEQLVPPFTPRTCEPVIQNRRDRAE
ncbi:uncharacterized protein DSM5745_05610 [Aspergillus mulundensis]|uniref:Pre-rRNA-processing protein RIX1 n=1 Tax=Aspergillus mulundensis TaxID=1810919 RepID=A0A3D8RXM4_9EURO|nr:Uncharacterized protein DSM5745_05610 [Aspergillus mulundensis]RDW78758.1 Uncharacterized protein DSM5745_05610 [Aspergillus mulundensis]